MNTKLQIIALVAVVTMAGVPVLVKSTAANEVTIGLARLSIACLLMTPVVLARGQLSLRTRSDWLHLMMIGSCFGLHWLLYFMSIKWSSAALGAIAVSTFGMHLLLINRVVKKSRIAPAAWAAVAVCILGCVLVVPPDVRLNPRSGAGLILGIASGFLYACLPLLHQRIDHVPTLTRAWGQFAFALLFFLPLYKYSDWQLAAHDWWYLLTLGLICTVLSHSLWVKASTELPAMWTSIVYYLYLPVAVILGAILLDEDITPPMALGGALILLANVSVALTGGRRTQHGSDS